MKIKYFKILLYVVIDILLFMGYYIVHLLHLFIAFPISFIGNIFYKLLGIKKGVLTQR